MSNLRLLAGCLVQSLLVVSLWQLACTEEGSTWEYDCLAPSQDPGQIFEHVRLRGLQIFLDIIFMLITWSDCTALNMCPVRQHAPSSCLTAWVIVPPSLQTSLNLAKVGSLNLVKVGS